MLEIENERECELLALDLLPFFHGTADGQRKLGVFSSRPKKGQAGAHRASPPAPWRPSCATKKALRNEKEVGRRERVKLRDRRENDVVEP